VIFSPNPGARSEKPKESRDLREGQQKADAVRHDGEIADRGRRNLNRWAQSLQQGSRSLVLHIPQRLENGVSEVGSCASNAAEQNYHGFVGHLGCRRNRLYGWRCLQKRG